MFTQCSHCKAIFRVSMKEITAAGGQLKCGECANIFDAMGTLSNTLPEQHSQRAEQTDHHPVFGGSASPQTASDFVQSRWFLPLAILTLILLLLLQLLYTNRNQLAQHPLTSDLTYRFCAITNCEIKPQRRVSEIDILSKNVYGHPNEPNALIISASMKNKTNHELPLPLIEVSFLNKTGETVALRRFRPQVYAKKPEGQEHFSPGETQTFRLKIADPGKEAVRFQFRFL